MKITENLRQQNIERFETLMGQVQRKGIEDLMNYIRTETDMYEAPASSNANFHLAVPGGLLQHSLNLYDCMLANIQYNPLWKKALENVSHESIIITCLLHDLCKCNFYALGTKNQKNYTQDKVAKAPRWQVKHDALGDFIWETVNCYKVEDQFPLGHGEKSCLLIMQYMKLTPEEMLAIRWHMGYSMDSSQYNTLSQALSVSDLVLAVHLCDMEASKLLEASEGNKDVYDGILPVTDCKAENFSIKGQIVIERNPTPTLFGDDDCPFI